ncbi:unnamed protein product [Vitrella brassicaformis CCMP3155]|uniref:Serine aminopeptidase S33 domain-containing protein n=2 Tax=Vitrella brassicaformis TaxID=1169539 RepID=A0A0G4F4V3_VITBC|nr:unnamed protein product [Vitrella brassicaformis CCMP3155]|mmetsp:Transcript_3164/g.7171  ORF Transcript_3164/g.7171 Transcript_3164/m.7171 type:complete len:570 (+) Transcript_3164:102-1811(+)|eukprot:CEM06844.1 unnamed protein product [Vitrella brassicaformis CCMP3155]
MLQPSASSWQAALPFVDSLEGLGPYTQLLAVAGALSLLLLLAYLVSLLQKPVASVSGEAQPSENGEEKEGGASPSIRAAPIGRMLKNMSAQSLQALFYRSLSANRGMADTSSSPRETRSECPSPYPSLPRHRNQRPPQNGADRYDILNKYHHYLYFYPRALSAPFFNPLLHLQPPIGGRFSLLGRRESQQQPLQGLGPMHPQYLLSDRGSWLYTRRWLHNAADPTHKTKAIIFLAHGWGEHGSRYEHVCQELARRGFDVYNMDFEAHGQSEQPHGCMAYFKAFSDHVNDMHKFVHTVMSNRPDAPFVPKYIVGHSMGSLVSFHLCLQHPRLFDGLVMLSPFIQGPPDVEIIRNSPTLRTLAKLLSDYMPKSWYRKGDVSVVSRVSSVVASYMKDPLLYRGGVPFRVGWELLEAGSKAKAQAHELRVPVFLCHGEMDKLAYPEGTMWMLQALTGTQDKTLKIIPQAYHELLHEVEWRDVLGDIITWIQVRIHRHSPPMRPQQPHPHTLATQPDDQDQQQDPSAPPPEPRGLSPQASLSGEDVKSSAAIAASSEQPRTSVSTPEASPVDRE